MKMNLTAILYLRPLTRSIRFRPYLASVDAKPVLARIAEQILTRCGASRLIILYHYEAEREPLEKAIANTGAELRATRHFSELQAIAEIGGDIKADQVAVLRLGCVLAPADLLLRMAEHHRQCQNRFTPLNGAPEGCSISIFEAATLIDLTKIAGKLESMDADDAMRRLQILGPRIKGDSYAMLATPFDFPSCYGVPLESLPLIVPTEREAEFKLLERAVIAAHDEGFGVDSPGALVALKKRQIEWESNECAIPDECVLKPAQPNSGKIHALFLSLPSAFSGAEQALCSMIKFLDSAIVTPIGVTAHEGVFAEKLRSVCAETIIPEWEVMGEQVENFSYALRLIRETNPDIVHFNSRAPLPFVCASIACGVPIVQHVRNADLNGFHNGAVAAKAIIAVSDFLRRETLRFPIREDLVHLVYDEVDSEIYAPEQFSKADCRRGLGLDKDAGIALMIARVAPNKRFDLMLDAAAQIRRSIPGFQLVLKGDIYGDSLLHIKIREQVQKLELEDTVRWMDFVPDIRHLMAAADVLVLCSDREGLGSCVVEAMSMALPVVVTNTGGTHEIVADGLAGGFVVPGGDAEQLASRVIELLADRDLRNRLGSAGREFVRGHLDARISARRVTEIYSTVISRSSA